MDACEDDTGPATVAGGRRSKKHAPQSERGDNSSPFTHDGTCADGMRSSPSGGDAYEARPLTGGKKYRYPDGSVTGATTAHKA